MSDMVERYEAEAATFYTETGVMAPGKDAPAAMGGYDADELRHKLWRVWARAVYAEREREELRERLAAAEAAREWFDAYQKLEDALWDAVGHDNLPPVGEHPNDLNLTVVRHLREWLVAVEDRRRALSDACYASERELAASRAECAAMRAVVEAAERMVDVQAQIEVLDVVDGDMAAYSQAETELGALHDNAEHDIHEAVRAYRATTPQGGGGSEP